MLNIFPLLKSGARVRTIFTIQFQCTFFPVVDGPKNSICIKWTFFYLFLKGEMWSEERSNSLMEKWLKIPRILKFVYREKTVFENHSRKSHFRTLRAKRAYFSTMRANYFCNENENFAREKMRHFLSSFSKSV